MVYASQHRDGFHVQMWHTSDEKSRSTPKTIPAQTGQQAHAILEPFIQCYLGAGIL